MLSHYLLVLALAIPQDSLPCPPPVIGEFTELSAIFCGVVIGYPLYHSLMSRISGSGGFACGLPGICADCFQQQTRDPHPPYYYCEHNQRLVVWQNAFWETFSNILLMDVPEVTKGDDS